MKNDHLDGQAAEWSAEQLREYLQQQHAEDYQLLDIRRSQEYQDKHLPGALWIPAEDLPLGHAALHADKTTIVYCAHGMLSRAAARILVREGFRDVCILQGGLHAWLYGTAVGLPALRSAHLAEAGGAKEQAIRAWQVEEETRRFYEEMANSLTEPAVADLFAELAGAESRHKATLKALWEALAGRVARDDFPGTEALDGGLMEGAVPLVDAIAWAAQSSPAVILDFAMALELSAYDHYLYLQRTAADPDSQRLFEVMADEERHHLKSFGDALRQLQSQGADLHMSQTAPPRHSV